MRRAGITSTEIACIVGCNPHRRPIDVYLEKIGAAVPFEGNARTRWGEILEGPIREDYERRHNVRVDVPGTLTATHKLGGSPWMVTTPDGLCYPAGSYVPERGMEIKVHSRDAVFYGQLEYGTPGTDEVPAHELVQCMWGMNITGLRRWDLIAFLDGAPVDYTIERDDEMIGDLVERGERFLIDHVRAEVPPPPDGSEAYTGWQKRKWKGKELNPEVLELDIDHPLRDTIMQLREVRLEITSNERIRDRHAQTIKEVLGDRTAIKWLDERGKWSTISWKRNRDGAKVEWDLVASAMRERAALTLSGSRAALERALLLAQQYENDEVVHETAVALDEAISALAAIASSAFETQHTKIVSGARPFSVPRHWSKNEADKPKQHDQEG